MSDLESLIRQLVRDELAKQTPTNDNTERVTVAEYARRWSLSPSTVRTAIREGRLPCSRVGRAVRIPADSEIAPPSKTVAQAADLKLTRRR